jgi:hypothetical protein
MSCFDCLSVGCESLGVHGWLLCKAKGFRPVDVDRLSRAVSKTLTHFDNSSFVHPALNTVIGLHRFEEKVKAFLKGAKED